jgi:hypothetical protein
MGWRRDYSSGIQSKSSERSSEMDAERGVGTTLVLYTEYSALKACVFIKIFIKGEVGFYSHETKIGEPTDPT